MKKNYINIIISELDKLTEEQLYKVLVLVKNTTEASNKFVPNVEAEEKVSKNKMIPGRGTIMGNGTNLYPKESKKIKELLLELNFTGGYGIMEMIGTSDIDVESSKLSTFIYFCTPDVIDCKIEITSTIFKPYYVLTTRRCEADEQNVFTAYSLQLLENALVNIAQITKK